MVSQEQCATLMWGKVSEGRTDGPFLFTSDCGNIGRFLLLIRRTGSIEGNSRAEATAPSVIEANVRRYAQKPCQNLRPRLKGCARPPSCQEDFLGQILRSVGIPDSVIPAYEAQDHWVVALHQNAESLPVAVAASHQQFFIVVGIHQVFITQEAQNLR